MGAATALKVDEASPDLPVIPTPARVDVYRNLNNACLSVRNFLSGHENYGNVVVHADAVALSDVTFVVQDASQEKAKETYDETGQAEGARNLHAFARGTCVPYTEVDGTALTYKPFDETMPDTFATLDGRPVAGADRLSIWLEEQDGDLRTFMAADGIVEAEAE